MSKDEEKRIYGKAKPRFTVHTDTKKMSDISVCVWATVFAMAVAGVIVLGMNVIAGHFNG